VRGDEWASYYETSGFVIEMDDDKWWKYITNDSQGNLVITDYRVGVDDPDGSGINNKTTLQNVLNISLLDKNGAMQFPTEQLALADGDAECIVILIRFSDVGPESTHTSSYFNNLLFNAEYPKSMQNYYDEVSYGKLNLKGTISTWYQSSKNMSYYGEDGATRDTKNTPRYELAREAVQLADDDIDFSQYDKNGDGVVDHVIIVHAGNDQSGSKNPNDIWSHRWQILPDGELVDGVKVRGYTVLAESSPVGTFAHEFGHDLGLPDLYDTYADNGDSEGVGHWDLMGSGSWLDNGYTPGHLSVWCKYGLGWITPIKVTSSVFGEHIANIENNSLAYMLSDNPNISPWSGQAEYFLVENREKTGFDSSLDGSGLLIWHIDESVDGNCNDDENHKLVDLEEADGLNDLDHTIDIYSPDYSPHARGDEYDPWKNSAYGFDGISNPNSDFYNGRESNVGVKNISAADLTMTADLIVNSLSPVFPVANFTSNVSEGFAPLFVQFNDSSKNATEVCWDFEDDGTVDSYELNPIHKFEDPGIYTVNLTAINENGTDSMFATINIIQPESVLPVANFTSNVSEGYAPLFVQFNGSSENATEVRWDFEDDGTVDSNELNPIHKFEDPGIYTVNLTAINENGTSSMFATMTVLDPLSYIIDKIVLNVTDPEGKLKEDKNVTAAGDVINYQVNVRNDGIIDLNNVIVTDSLIKDKLTLSNSSINNDTVLNAEETWTYIGNYTVTEEDINSNGNGTGFIINNATVVCDELGPKTDTEEVSIKSAHYIIYKAVISPDDNGDCIVNSLGDEIPYRIVVKNDGSKVLHNFTVNDSKINLTAQISELSPKEIWEQNVTYKLTQADMNNARENNDWNITNTLNVSCKELPTLKSITIKTPIAKKVDLSIYKSTRGIDDARDKILNDPGDIINYQVVVENIGNVKFTNVNVSDPMVTLTKVAGDHNKDDALDPGELWEFRGNYTVTEANIANTYISNKATVSCNIGNTNATKTANSTLVLLVIQKPPELPETPGDIKPKVLPLANFSANPASGNAPLSVQFIDLSQNASSLSWDFDNNGVADSSEVNPVYKYTAPGTYTAKLTVRNGNETYSKEVKITVLQASISSSGSSGRSSGGSSHSSGGSNRPVVISSSTVNSSPGKTDTDGNVTVIPAQNKTPAEQNTENVVENPEQTTEQENNTNTPVDESKKTPAFGIISGIICLSGVFMCKRKRQ
jgi:M6 family metalloprotease-like protein/uncharacterized repeat protein (TIGR01451 family)